MLDTLSGPDSITWNIEYIGSQSQMTFKSDGTGNIGKTIFHYSVGPSGNPDFPLAFIAQAPHPVMQQVVQVWSGIVNNKGGAGFLTNDWGSAQPGSLATFTMTYVS